MDSGADVTEYGELPVQDTAMYIQKRSWTRASFKFFRLGKKNNLPRYGTGKYSRPLISKLFGLNWWSKCSGNEAFWDLNEAERSAMHSQGHGNNLFFSDMWRDCRPNNGKCDMVLLMCNYYFKFKTDSMGQNGQRAKFSQLMDSDSGTMVQYIKNGDTTRIYTVVRTWKQLVYMYSLLPLADRHMEEIIHPCTPHKFYLDVEREIKSAHTVTAAEADQELQEITEVFEETFLPYLREFAEDVLGIEDMDINDLVVSYSSKRGVKFSAHIVLSDKAGHYFANRANSHAAASLLAKFMHEKALADQDFNDWYYYSYDKVMVDYTVYGQGQRNMRMIGCCKVNAQLRSGTHWKQARVFVPRHGDGKRPLKDYIISLYDAVSNPTKYTPITFNHSQRVDAARFASEGIGMRFIQRVDALRQFAGLSGGSRGAMRNPTGTNFEMREQNMGDRADSALLALLPRLTPDASSICSKIAESCKGSPESWKDYYEVGKRIIGDTCRALHPGNSPRLESSRPQDGDPWLWRVRMTANVPGVCRGEKTLRYCYFGCYSGQHEVRLYLFNDYSIGYYCFGHKCTIRRGIIMDSPIRKSNKVRPGIAAVADYSPEFAPGVIDYDLVPHGPNDDDQHMRTLSLPEEKPGGAATDKVTYILHGGMGTGKTTAVKALLEKCRLKRTDPRIISISFRVMLAKNASETLGLEYYKRTTERFLGGVNELALQLDSMERLLDPDGGDEGHFKLKCDHDVVVLDELCSLLAHLDSSTLSNKLNNVWNTFFTIVKHARILVCCDADIGPREQRFIRMTRGIFVSATTAPGAAEQVDFTVPQAPSPDAVTIPNLMYHRNHYVGIKTEFIDYKGEYEWANQIVKCAALDRLNCFVVSNSLNQIERLKRWIEDSIREIMLSRQQLILSSDGGNPDKVNEDGFMDHLENLLTSINTITSRSTDTEKDKMSDSNRTWVDSKLLIISPTVGAGVDFNEKHFDVSFVYATNKSCCARAINQMRGRTRDISTGKCHVYISSISGDTTGNEPHLPITPVATLQKLFRSRQAFLLEPLDGNVMQNGAVSFGRPVVDNRLVEIQAHSLAETNRSILNMRMEWVRLQQAADSGVAYSFDDTFNIPLNRHFAMMMSSIGEKMRTMRVVRVANQQDLNKEQLVEAQKLDKEARLAELQPNQQVASLLLEKNIVRKFYGIAEGVDPTMFTSIYNKTNATNAGLEQLDNTIRVLFIGINDLYSIAKDRKLTSASVIVAVEPATNKVNTTIRSSQRMSQESAPTDFEKRVWVKMLLLACGSNIAAIETNLFKAFELHRAVAAERLATDNVLQKWLKDVTMHRYHLFGVKHSARTFPTEGKDFTWTNVYAITNSFFDAQFGIRFKMTGYNKATPTERSSGACNLHKFTPLGGKPVNCTIASATREQIELLLEMVYARLTSGSCDIDEPYLTTVLAGVKQAFTKKKFYTDFMSSLAERKPTDRVAIHTDSDATTQRDNNNNNGANTPGSSSPGSGIALDDRAASSTSSSSSDTNGVWGNADSRAVLSGSDAASVMSGSNTDTMEDNENQSIRANKRIRDIETVPDSKRHKASKSAEQRIRAKIKKRDSMWNDMKKEFTQNNPVQMDAITYHNQMLTRPYKIHTTRTIRNIGIIHRANLQKFIDSM
jgi:hypothetical protein